MKRDTCLKKTYRQINRHIRKLNKNIEQDNLWQGRFVVRMVEKQRYRYSDNSGYAHTFVIKFIDKKTGQYSLNFYHYPSILFHLFWDMNDFIVKDINVWENENLWEEKKSYLNTPIPKDLKIIPRQQYYV